MAPSKCAIYCRLSRDDGTMDDSSSIQTQKEALSKYALNNNYEIYKIYIDDGISGTHDQRPGFQEMLRDAENGKFQILLTKDLSRLARNYLQAGYYMEEFFPKHHIRYIAVNDNYDSYKDDNEFAPFKNIINEWYAKDISKKVKYAFANKRREGKIPTGTTALYGYVYDEERNRVIDPVAAEVVRKIFNLYIKYQSSLKIKKILAEEKVYSPGYYLYITQGVNKAKYENCTEEEKYEWNTHRINALLRNREYKGDLVLNKTHIDKVGSNHEVRTDADKLVIHEKRFEPIISDSLFDDVQRMIDGNKIQRLPVGINKFKSLVKCPCCHEPLKYRRSCGSEVYVCRNKRCSNRYMVRKSIIEKAIENEVKFLQETLSNKRDDLYVYAKAYSLKNDKKDSVDYEEISMLKKRNNQIDQFIEKLIEGNIDGTIPASTYNTMLLKYKKEHDENDNKLKSLTSVKPKIDSTLYLDTFLDALKNINPKEFDYELFNTLVTHIEVSVTKITHLNRKYNFTFYYRIDGKMLEGFINEQGIVS